MTQHPKMSPITTLLQKYYSHVCTFRQYLVDHLVSSKIADLNDCEGTREDLSHYLDSTLICFASSLEDEPVDLHDKYFVSHSEFIASVIDNGLRINGSSDKNLLTLGYSRGNERNRVMYSSRAGNLLVNDFPNSSISHLNNSIWSCLVLVLGHQITSDILLHTSIYVNVNHDSYYQLTGKPMTDKLAVMPKGVKRESSVTETAAAIIVRSRLFYARPAYDSKKSVVFGLRHIHLLNRTTRMPKDVRAHQLLANIFPLQYNLHNVFSSDVNKKETVQPFKDYTMRDDVPHVVTRRPKQLNTILVAALEQMAQNHARCSYIELLHYYCPIGDKSKGTAAITWSRHVGEEYLTQAVGKSPASEGTAKSLAATTPAPELREVLTDYACAANVIVGFLQAILFAVLPENLLGRPNLERLSENLQSLLFLRRYESTTLHDLLQGLAIKEIPWLNTQGGRKYSLTEMRKKEELLAELIYWIVDSFVMPVLKSHFYITESHLYRNRVLFFRHDLWHNIVEKELAKLKLNMLSEIDTASAIAILQARQLGYAHLRLLPKGGGARPITNLKRRGMTKDGIGRTAKGLLLPSINSIMQSVYSVISYECQKKPDLLGFSIGSVSGLQPRLKRFRQAIQEDNHKGKLYFAKVDVKSCFDTIEQDKVIAVVVDALLEDTYMLQRFCAIVPSLGKVARRFSQRAIAQQDFEDFSHFAHQYAHKKNHVILIDGVTHQFRERDQLIALLKEHIMMHIIKIGKRYFRQDTGIPQGSILSSILCNMYYSDLESKTLPFLQKRSSLCMRLIDDFLLITTHRQAAERFLQVMHEGNTEYGCFVSISKSLANFEVVAAGSRLPVLAGTHEFPYCGTTINMTTLNIRKDFSKTPTLSVSDTLTMDYTNKPGGAIVSKIFQGLKLSCQTIFVDTKYNSLHTVLLNLYRSYAFGALRFIVALSDLRKPNSSLQAHAYDMVVDLTQLVFVYLKSRTRTDEDVQCAVTRVQCDWLGKHAFWHVLRSRCAGYEKCLNQLSCALNDKHLTRSDVKLLKKASHYTNLECFADFQY